MPSAPAAKQSVAVGQVRLNIDQGPGGTLAGAHLAPPSLVTNTGVLFGARALWSK